MECTAAARADAGLFSMTWRARRGREAGSSSSGRPSRSRAGTAARLKLNVRANISAADAANLEPAREHSHRRLAGSNETSRQRQPGYQDVCNGAARSLTS